MHTERASSPSEWLLPGDDPDNATTTAATLDCFDGIVPDTDQVPMATDMEAATMPPLSSSLLTMFRRLATPPSSPALGRSNIPRASSPLARRSPSGLVELSPAASTLVIKPLEASSSRPHCDAELILKRPTPVKPPRLSTTFGDPVGDVDEGGASSWKSASLAILLSIVMSFLFVALAVPREALLEVRPTWASAGRQPAVADSRVGLHFQDDIMAGLFDARTLGHLAAVLSACREIRVARAALSDLAVATQHCVAALSTARPVVVVSALVREVVDALRTLLLIFF